MPASMQASTTARTSLADLRSIHSAPNPISLASKPVLPSLR